MRFTIIISAMKRSHTSIDEAYDDIEDDNVSQGDIYEEESLDGDGNASIAMALQLVDLPQDEASSSIVAYAEESYLASENEISKRIERIGGLSLAAGIHLHELRDVLAIDYYPDIISSNSIELVIRPSWPTIPTVVTPSGGQHVLNVNYKHITGWINEELSSVNEEPRSRVTREFPALPDSWKTFCQLPEHAGRGIMNLDDFREFIGLPTKIGLSEGKQDFNKTVYEHMLSSDEAKWLVLNGRGANGEVLAGCLYCYMAKEMEGDNKTRASTWAKATANVDFKAAKPRETARKHVKDSASHAKAKVFYEGILEGVASPRQPTVTALFQAAVDRAKADPDTIEALKYSFMMAHFVACTGMPFALAEHFANFDKALGTPVSHHVDIRSIQRYQRFMAETYQRAIVRYITSNGLKLSLLCDESSDKSRQRTLAVSLRFAVSEDSSMEHFFDMLEIKEAATAEAQANLILDRFEELGLTRDYLDKNLLVLVADGASVNTGADNGLAVQIANKIASRQMQMLSIPTRLRVITCKAHDLDLAVKAANKDQADSLQQFLKFYMLVKTFYRSPKQWAGLRAVAKIYRIPHPVKFSSIFNVRWSASSFNNLTNFWRCIEAINIHLQTLRERSGKVRETAEIILSFLTSVNFLKNLAGLIDILNVCTSASLELQIRGYPAEKLLKLVEDLKSKVSNSLSNANSLSFKMNVGIEHGRFGSFYILENSRVKLIDFQSYIGVFIRKIEQRMTRDKSSDIFNATVYFSPDEFRRRLNEIQSIKDVVSRENRKAFVREESINVAKLLFQSDCLYRIASPEEKQQIKNDLSDFGTDSRMEIFSAWPQSLKQLWKRLTSVPVSTAEVERYFSDYNKLKSSLRTSLTVAHIRDMQVIRHHGIRDITYFDPNVFVKKWLDENITEAKPRLCKRLRGNEIAKAHCERTVKDHSIVGIHKIIHTEDIKCRSG